MKKRSIAEVKRSIYRIGLVFFLTLFFVLLLTAVYFQNNTLDKSESQFHQYIDGFIKKVKNILKKNI